MSKFEASAEMWQETEQEWNKNLYKNQARNYKNGITICTRMRQGTVKEWIEKLQETRKMQQEPIRDRDETQHKNETI